MAANPGHAIHVFDLNTGTETTLTDGSEDDLDPAWSLDGESIVFIRGSLPFLVQECGIMYRMDPDGSNLEQLSTGAGADCGPLAWNRCSVPSRSSMVSPRLFRAESPSP